MTWVELGHMGYPGYVEERAPVKQLTEREFGLKL